MKQRTKHLTVRNGNLIPLGNNFAYVLGDHPNKVDDVDIGPNNKNGLSVNHGEIMQFGRTGVRVFSAEPILNGVSPSKLVQSGVNPNTVFAAQEKYKDIHHLKDDGTHAKFGLDNDDDIDIPVKYDKPLSFKSIPTKNKIHIIDNYSPNFNYIVEGDKIYYMKKGLTDNWVDISDNNVARKNLYNFLSTKYNFRGYEDNESEIAKDIASGKFNYLDYHNSLYSKSNNSITNDNTKKELSFPIVYNLDLDPTKASAPIPQTSSTKVAVAPKTQKTKSNIISGITSKIRRKLDIEDNTPIIPFMRRQLVNGATRAFEKRFKNNEEISSISIPTSSPINSNYGIIPSSYTGDTLNVKGNNRRYFIPESLDLSEYSFGVRNRGDYTELASNNAPITTFNEFAKYGEHKEGANTYIGTDKNGNIKIGPISDFGDGDFLSPTYSNDIYDFAKDNKGNYIFKDDAKHGNASRNVVGVLTKDKDGSLQTKFPLNILVNKNDTSASHFGNVDGGRVIMKAGDEIRLVSGSVADIEKEFNAIKNRHNTDYVTFYTLDNGSYNRALRVRDNKITKSDLINYDSQNNGGGNFMYIKGAATPKFPSDTVLTPFIRTMNDESYKKGHPLVNERQGVVLHHTGYTDDKDLKAVTNQFLYDKKQESSSHVVIGEDGRRRIFATPDKVTFHGGSSRFNERLNVNDFMLGIEFQGDTNKHPLTDSQIESAVEYLKPIIRENNIPLENITTHETVRKLYNDYVAQYNKGRIVDRLKTAPNKPDITETEYNRIVNALIGNVYYKNDKNTNNKKLGGETKVKNDYLTIPLKGNPLYDISGETKYSDYVSNHSPNFSTIKTTNNRPYNQQNVETAYNYFKGQGANDYQIAAFLANAIEESGIEPYALDATGVYYGLSQWDKGRYSVSRKSKKDKDYSIEGESKDLNNQLMYYYNSVMNGNTTSDWNHGGKGSGYNTAADARQAFRNATSVDDAIKALVLGYVRPTGGIDSYKNRAKVAEQIYKLISKQ